MSKPLCLTTLRGFRRLGFGGRKLRDIDITAKIRQCVECGEDEQLIQEAVPVLAELKQVLDDWIATHGDSDRMPPEVYRIDRYFRWISGESIPYGEDPRLLVAHIIGTQEHSADVIDMMPLIQGLTLAAEWNGVPGQEPDWLVELDTLLWKYYYNVTLEGSFEGTEKIQIENDIRALSISDRARSLTVFGYNEPAEAKQEDPRNPLLVDRSILTLATIPKPASIVSTDFDFNGEKVIVVKCKMCGTTDRGNDFLKSSAWVDKHNSECIS